MNLRETVHRVVEVAGRGTVGAAPAGQVEREGGAGHALEERLPVLGVARVAVDEDDRRAVPVDAPKEGGDAVDHHCAGLDLGHGGAQ